MKHMNRWIALFMVTAVICLCGCSASKTPPVTPDASEETMAENLLPWEKEGKQPEEYTWAEYEALSEQQKAVFVASFESAEAFDEWKSRVTGTSEAETMPWEKEGKQPKDYTWAEYEAMTVQQKEAFFDSFESSVEFDDWMSRVTGASEVETMPWEDGGKQPKDYTWAEYEALTAQQKEAFFDNFGSSVEFDNWVSRVTGTTAVETMPWEDGGKQPKDYTWAEYEALTASQKEAFVDSFESVEAFDAWMAGNNGTTAVEKIPWEDGSKQPAEYTWAEYEALTAQQKEAFYDSFESAEDFDNWMSRVTGTSEMETMPWEKGGKQPGEYTWAEYEALTPLQKEAFFDHFEDVNAFEAWLTANQN